MKMTIKRYSAAAVDMFHLDAATWPLAGVTSTAGISGQGVTNKVVFCDYKKVDGVQIPHTLELVEPTFASFIIGLDSVKHNIKAGTKWFQKTK